MFCCWRGRKSNSPVHSAGDQMGEVFVIPPAHVPANLENRMNILDTSVRRQTPDCMKINNYGSDLDGSLKFSNITTEPTCSNQCGKRISSAEHYARFLGRKLNSPVHFTDDQIEEVSVNPPVHVPSNSENRMDISDTNVISRVRRQKEDCMNINSYGSELDGSLKYSNINIERTFSNQRGKRIPSADPDARFRGKFKTSSCNPLTTGSVLGNQYQSQAVYIDLCIVVKSAMQSHFCYLGLDLERKRLFRPIFRTKEHRFGWKLDMTVDSVYTFKVLQFPNGFKKPITPLPNGNDDLLVEHTVKLSKTENNTKVIFHKLQSIAKSSLEDIFFGITKKKYVRELEDSPSVGVLRCHGSDIKIMKLNNNKTRIQIGRYNLPYTGLDTRNRRTSPKVKSDSQMLVILGLARPWKGVNSDYNTRRCGILVLRILQLPE